MENLEYLNVIYMINVKKLLVQVNINTKNLNLLNSILWVSKENLWISEIVHLDPVIIHHLNLYLNLSRKIMGKFSK